MEVFVEHFSRLHSTSVVVRIPRDEIVSARIEKHQLVINEKHHITLANDSKKVLNYNEEGLNITIKELDTQYTGITLRSKQIARTLLTNDDRMIDMMCSDNYQWNIGHLTEMNDRGTFRCASCKQSTIFQLSSVKRMLPMPSELWYEMLDFWHCHKPNEEDEHARNVSYLRKFNQLRPQPQCLILGAYYMIVNPEDWDGIRKAENDSLLCDHCGELIGELDSSFGNYKILNWKMELIVGEADYGDEVEQFKPYNYVMEKLVDETRYSGGRLFTVAYKEKKVKVWCFGEGIDFAVGDTNDGMQFRENCMKIMYQEYDPEKDGGLHVVEVEYEKPFDSFLEHIKLVNSRLPVPSKTFKEWNISYIS